ncbi:MAG: hypothetical protein ABJC89_06070 [Acidobacteriota bacterium]
MSRTPDAAVSLRDYEPGLRRLRAAALAAVVAGGLFSAGLMLWVGRRNSSWVLKGLFTIWDLSPFAALLLVDAASTRWSRVTRATLYAVMVATVAGSVAAYADVVLRPPASSPAFRFLITPAASWVLLALAVPVAAFVNRRTSRR